ncbi:hypothetical protein [Tessaracoccus sp. MC1756]|uniref:hypothetical protein n=1 Tax=Tessaracoccus sp. MC1756 TaxID=2760311 RepID=UPI0016036DBC|nr:hypothetical protein [Tessaracoccus sp. MC1756]MBB1510416.1 hypothetical protein [Tessaracoccus sp. MC1756]
MSRFTVTLHADCPPPEALSRVLDLRAHSRVIPFTTLTPAPSFAELEPGARFVARTAIGPFGFDDPMVVEHLDAGPGRCSARLRKQGRAIRGLIRVECLPDDGGATVIWRQAVHLPWWPRRLHWLAVPVLRAGYRRVLRRLLAESSAP